MILSFRCRKTEALASGSPDRKFPPSDIRAIASRKLAMLERAVTVDDLRVPPGNRLEKLSGEREGQWSIRINDQWRICFRWQGTTVTQANGETIELIGAHDVEIVDYH